MLCLQRSSNLPAWSTGLWGVGGRGEEILEVILLFPVSIQGEQNPKHFSLDLQARFNSCLCLLDTCIHHTPVFNYVDITAGIS